MLFPDGLDIIASSPDTLAKFVSGETARWGKVVRDNKIKAGE